MQTRKGLGIIGSYNDTVSVGSDIIQRIRNKERYRVNPQDFRIRRIAITAPEATEFRLNYAKIVMPQCGTFELDANMCEIETLTFDSEATVCIVYIL